MHRVLHTAVVVICALALFAAVVFSYDKCIGEQGDQSELGQKDSSPCHE